MPVDLRVHRSVDTGRAASVRGANGPEPADHPADRRIAAIGRGRHTPSAVSHRLGCCRSCRAGCGGHVSCATARQGCDGGRRQHPAALSDRSLPDALGKTAAAQTGAVVAAVSFTWLGMVLAISFLEAPLKFRAPGVTVPLGLGIGRLVFRALNRVEMVLLVLALVGVAVAPRPALIGTAAALAVLVGVQLGVVRPTAQPPVGPGAGGGGAAAVAGPPGLRRARGRQGRVAGRAGSRSRWPEDVCRRSTAPRDRRRSLPRTSRATPSAGCTSCARSAARCRRPSSPTGAGGAGIRSTHGPDGPGDGLSGRGITRPAALAGG